jgi:hypothetical protein
VGIATGIAPAKIGISLAKTRIYVTGKHRDLTGNIRFKRCNSSENRSTLP